MLSACKKPFPNFRCGQCQYCRVLDRMDKVNRLKLEYGMRPHAFFVTLTYSDEYLPVFNYSKKAELFKPDLIKFIDNIRRKLPKITIFAVGEYGGKLFGTDTAKRDIHPHYHLAIFCDYHDINDRIRAVCEDKWFMGHVHILRLSNGLIDYITGYVSKKLTNTFSMEKITGLNIRPEFAYSSRRPAIGDISAELISVTEEHGEIDQLSIDGKNVVIPKYLRFKIKNEFLKWDLDLTNPSHRKIYEQRKEASKRETLQKLYEKKEEENEKIMARKALVGSVYQRRSELKKQIVANFHSKFELLKNSKGKKVI